MFPFSAMSFQDGPLPEQLRRVQEREVLLGLRHEGEYAMVQYWLPGFFADLYIRPPLY
ncbi:hypothetical protein LJY25_17440 [Hymenobacter sp. BT175]|nr:hypothetical protein [Hymenobacter translucens]